MIPVGAVDPGQVLRTRRPLSIIERHIGRDEGPTVIRAADERWRSVRDGWATLFPGDALPERHRSHGEAGETTDPSPLTGAHDDGSPRLRVRRLPDGRRLLRARPRYEVAYTPVGSGRALWSSETDDPRELLEPYWGVADTHAVLAAADPAWDGGVGAWESLLPGDRDLARGDGRPSHRSPAYASLVPVVELLVAHGNSLADDGFLNSPGGWYCRMTKTLDIDLVERERDLPASVDASRDLLPVCGTTAS
ncbi:hypothetical protein KLP28_13730 [Nocardioidaceae bacterium]|nr:hypothetical protein KLP28_13730 [Nocardioidaceae bacterium]